MKTKNSKTMITGLLLAVMNINPKAQETAVEWAPFIKLPMVTEEELITKADAVNNDFLVKQRGFITRELIKKDDTEYADVVYWESRSDAINASAKVNTCTTCAEYFELMNMDLNAGGGFSHYTIVKSWAR